MIAIKNLTIGNGTFEVKGINLAIADQDHVVLVGPTGTGKSTLAETIVGSRLSLAGEITINGRPIHKLPSNQRQIGYVPQDVCLFPGLSVTQQVGFSLHVRNINRPDRERRIAEVLAAMDLSDLADFRPSMLSGGQRQRVALARAIAWPPAMLCLDEPFSAMDVDQRSRLLDFLNDYRQQQKIPILHITHQISDLQATDCRLVKFADLGNQT